MSESPTPDGQVKHGFDAEISAALGRYVCTCEQWKAMTLCDGEPEVYAKDLARRCEHE